jgi:hypothetical protein
LLLNGDDKFLKKKTARKNIIVPVFQQPSAQPYKVCILRAASTFSCRSGDFQSGKQSTEV